MTEQVADWKALSLKERTSRRASYKNKHPDHAALLVRFGEEPHYTTFLTPIDLTVGQFRHVLHERLGKKRWIDLVFGEVPTGFFESLWWDGSFESASLMQQVHDERASEDGFVYVTATEQAEDTSVAAYLRSWLPF